MDDTPETTHALHGVWYRGDHGSTIPELCRRLERERDMLANSLKTIRFTAVDKDIRQLADEAINSLGEYQREQKKSP